MDFIFNEVFIRNNEVVFYIYLAAIIIMILFGAIKTYKEIKNDNK